MLSCSERLAALLALFAVATCRAEAPATTLQGPFTRDTYPQAVIDRPLTLPAGMVEGELGSAFRTQTLPAQYSPTRREITFEDWLIDGTLRVGLTDRIQLEAGTAFVVDHSVLGGSLYYDERRPSLASWSRVVPVRLSLLALDTDSLDTAITLTIPFRANARRVFIVGRGTRVVSQNGDGRVVPEVDLAAPTRFRLTDWLWFRAGEDLFRVTTGDTVGVFNFRFGVGLQLHRLFAVTLDSSLASVVFDGSGSSGSATVADRGTLDVGAIFSPLPCLDFVGLMNIPDVGRGFDDYQLRSAVRFRF